MHRSTHLDVCAVEDHCCLGAVGADLQAEYALLPPALPVELRALLFLCGLDLALRQHAVLSSCCQHSQAPGVL